MVRGMALGSFDKAGACTLENSCPKGYLCVSGGGMNEPLNFVCAFVRIIVAHRLQIRYIFFPAEERCKQQGV